MTKVRAYVSYADDNGFWGGAWIEAENREARDALVTKLQPEGDGDEIEPLVIPVRDSDPFPEPSKVNRLLTLEQLDAITPMAKLGDKYKEWGIEL